MNAQNERMTNDKCNKNTKNTTKNYNKNYNTSRFSTNKLLFSNLEFYVGTTFLIGQELFPHLHGALRHQNHRVLGETVLHQMGEKKRHWVKMLPKCVNSCISHVIVKMWLLLIVLGCLAFFFIFKKELLILMSNSETQ